MAFLTELKKTPGSALPLKAEVKVEMDFAFGLFYSIDKTYFPKNILPSSKFLTWFIGFTEGEGSFMVNNRGDLAFVITQ